MTQLRTAWLSYRLRLRRRRFIARAIRKRRELTNIISRVSQIRSSDILLFATVRNEIERLPFFLEHYRKLGVNAFLIIDNGSDDGTLAFLKAQPDVSIWQTQSSYKKSRFGMDWITYLQLRYAHNHWCLTVDADELLVYPHHDTRPLIALTTWLTERGRQSFGALMLELYPKGPIADSDYQPGTDPTTVLNWFDHGNYVYTPKHDLKNLWIQGGVRARMFFSADPRRAPTLGKVPLVKWNRRYAYVSSTHSALPTTLNSSTYDREGGELLSGVLIHTKFLNTAPERAKVEKERAEHFANSVLYDTYYERLARNPSLWSPYSTQYQGWRQLERIGLMSRGGWL